MNFWGKGVQTKGTVCAKALRQEQVGSIRGTEKRLEGQVLRDGPAKV